MTTEWRSFNAYGCNSSRSWRYLDDGRIEIEGLGMPDRSWPAGVDHYLPLLQKWSDHYGVPVAQAAAIMALETGGTNVCRTSSGTCTGANCTCVSGEGCGPMATMPGTVKLVVGLDHTPSCNEIMGNEDMAVQAGVGFLKMQLDRYQDFVAAAVGYNAGSVKCGAGKTWGSSYPKQSCPDPEGWGVVVGCMYGSRSGSLCVPSQVDGTPPFICTSNYPHTAATFLNAAIGHLGGEPITPPPLVTTKPFPVVAALAFMAGGVAAYYSLRLLGKKTPMLRPSF